MSAPLTLGSLFDGSGGFPLAAALNGITPLWASEVEAYPIAVTRSRFPHMRHYGDVNNINGAEIEPVDIITFGSPCQDMSVAGKREGLKHTNSGDGSTTRSGLFMEAIRIIKEMRCKTNGAYPRYAVWENVPGAFSSNKGRDFYRVLEAFCAICDDTVSIPEPKKQSDKFIWLKAGTIVGDGYSLAWRTVDAQYWGVSQRRRRIYLVADFTSERAGEISFKPKSRSWDLSACYAARKETTAETMGGTNGSNRNECLNTEPFCIAANVIGRKPKNGGNGIGYQTGISYTLTGADRHVVAYSDTISIDCRNFTANPELSGTLQAKSNRGQSLNFINPVCYANNGYASFRESTTAATLRVNSGFGGGAENLAVFDARGNGDAKTVNTLIGDHQNRVTDYTALLVEKALTLLRRYIVRRLTPLECCRLQGFPDGWSDIPKINDMTETEYDFWKKVIFELAVINKTARPNASGGYDVWREIKPDKKKGEDFKPYWENTEKAYKHKSKKQIIGWYNKLHSDSAEYKMWGNGIALPNADYVLGGIAQAEITKKEAKT